MRLPVLVALCAIPALLYSQGIVVAAPSQGIGEVSDYFYRVVDTMGTTPRIGAVIYGRTFTGGVTDTTQIISTYRAKSLWIHLLARDTTTIRISYRLSSDGKVWTPFRASDSLKIGGETRPFLKSMNFSAAADSARFIQFRFVHSAQAYAFGTTTPTYTATYAIKRD